MMSIRINFSFDLENKLPLTFWIHNGCHINTCQTPTPLNWYNYHLHVCCNGRLNLSVRLMKKSSHVEINLSNQFCPQLSRAFKWNNKSTSIFSCVNKTNFISSKEEKLQKPISKLPANNEICKFYLQNL